MLKKLILLLGLFALILPGTLPAQEMTKSYNIWLGSHSLDFSDYTRQVGQYTTGENKTWTELSFGYLVYGGDRKLAVDASYLNEADNSFAANWIVGQASKGSVSYKSYEVLDGQDLLTNLSVRELIGANPGGKIITHELLDPNADYRVKRQELTSSLDLLLVPSHNVRFQASHRSIWKSGHDQALASSHCATCHIVSQTGTVKRASHQIQVGLQADVSSMTVGYELGYRKFESTAPEITANYENAEHPSKNPGTNFMGDEFGSRLNYEDSDELTRSYPTTEKLSHRLRLKGDLGKGRFNGSIRYFRSANRSSNILSDGVSGAFNYVVPISDKTRLTVKASGNRLWNDPVFIDLATFRDGRSGVTQDFDYTRYSNLDRRTGKLSATLAKRLSKTTKLTAMVGFNQTTRFVQDVLFDDETTDQIVGQLDYSYRPSSEYKISAKYRLELTNNPFANRNGLFEARGEGVLYPLIDGTTTIFYFQREDLRYQNITTLPTEKHVGNVKFGWHPSSKINVLASLKVTSEKNSELDSLEVTRFAIRPNLNLTTVVTDNLSFSLGYTANIQESTGPITVALFDG